MAALVDTNVLVYWADPGDPERMSRATELMAEGARTGRLVLCHQNLVEFMAATTRPRRGRQPLLALRDAAAAVQGFMADFTVLYPDADVVGEAFAGAALYGLSWYDAHLWAYASAHRIPEILSEDMHDGGEYGRVRIVNPFRGL